jgi:hypothetical protein
MGELLEEDTRIHADIQLHAGNDVQFRLVGIGSDVKIHTLVKTGFGFNPPVKIDAVATTIDTHDMLTDEMGEKREAQKPANWVDDLLALRGPAATTTLRRRPNTFSARPALVDTTVANVEVREVAPAAATSFSQIAARTWGVIPTSGEGLLCGARALKTSMDALSVAENLHAPQLDQVVETLTGAIATEEDREHADAAGVSIDVNNFTVDQMSVAAERMGYRLGVIEAEVDGSHRVWLHAGPHTTDGDPVVYVHNDNGHWSGVGPSDRPIRAVDTPS